jgi:predicted DNA-binding transcriptional regulator YafY
VATGRRWYLLAFDLDRDDWRTFRLDRVSEVRATTFRFRPREAPDVASYVQRSVTVSPYQHEARVLVHAPAEVVRERVPPTVGSVERVDDATCRVVAGANSLEALAWHFGALGHPFTVEAPAELRAVVAGLGARLVASAVARET